jgi:hypothetical protein
METPNAELSTPNAPKCTRPPVAASETTDILGLAFTAVHHETDENAYADPQTNGTKISSWEHRAHLSGDLSGEARRAKTEARHQGDLSRSAGFT